MKKKLPMVLMLQRKSIRMFPDDVSVGLYYCDDIDQYFVISSKTQSVTEETNEFSSSDTRE